MKNVSTQRDRKGTLVGKNNYADEAMDFFMQDIPKVTSETMTGQGLLRIRNTRTLGGSDLEQKFIQSVKESPSVWYQINI